RCRWRCGTEWLPREIVFVEGSVCDSPDVASIGVHKIDFVGVRLTNAIVAREDNGSSVWRPFRIGRVERCALRDVYLVTAIGIHHEDQRQAAALTIECDLRSVRRP